MTIYIFFSSYKYSLNFYSQYVYADPVLSLSDFSEKGPCDLVEEVKKSSTGGKGLE